MASDSQEVTPRPFDYHSRIADPDTPFPSIWPPVYAHPRGGERFREYAWRIDFENNSDADDMFAFASRTSVPYLENYPAATEDMVAHPRSLIPGSESISDADDMVARAPVPSIEINSNEDEDEELAQPAPVSPRPSSPPQAPLRAEDFPPHRGTGLGKTTVLIRQRPRAVQPLPGDVVSASTGRPQYHGMGPPNNGIPPIPRPHGAETLSAAIEMRVSANRSAMSPPARPVVPYTGAISAARVTVRVTSDMGAPPRPGPRVGTIGAGNLTSDANPSDMGPPPKRRRLITERFTQSKVSSKREDSAKPTAVANHRYQAALQTAMGFRRIEGLGIARHEVARTALTAEERSLLSEATRERFFRERGFSGEQPETSVARSPDSGSLGRPSRTLSLWPTPSQTTQDYQEYGS